jgi:hypothetical protein
MDIAYFLGVAINMGELEFRAQILAHVDEGEKFNQE